MTRGISLLPLQPYYNLQTPLADFFFGDNHSFNETRFQNVRTSNNIFSDTNLATGRQLQQQVRRREV